MSEKIRVAAYVRVSSKSDQLTHSLEAQTAHYTDLVNQNPNWKLVGIYSDNGISGMSMKKRAGFLQLLSDCNQKKIDKILVKSVSRFARNTVDLLNVIRQLRLLGISVWFEEQQMDSLTAEGELMLALIAGIAQAESESISENAKWAIRKSFQHGIGNTRHRMFGYEWNEEKLMIVPDEAVVVRRIYTEFLSGISMSKIAKKLASEGVKTITGKPFPVSAVSFLLRNITYTGNLLLQKTFVSDPFSKKKIINTGQLPKYFVEKNHDAIIDMDTFSSVQEKLNENKKNQKFPYNHTKENHLFTGKVICGLCGRHYTRQLWNSGKGGIRRATWVCTGKKNGGKRACSSKNISEDALIKFCLAELELSQFDENTIRQSIQSITIFPADKEEKDNSKKAADKEEKENDKKANEIDKKEINTNTNNQIKKEKWQLKIVRSGQVISQRT